MNIETKTKEMFKRLHLQNEIKSCVEFFHFHKNNKNLKDVLLLSTPRSGSTLLLDAISLNPKIKVINEPLYPKRGELKKVMMPKDRWCELTENEEKKFKGYFKYLLSNKMSTYPILSPQHKWITNRTFIKILRTPGLLDWFLENYNFHIIYLVRHPIPSSLSRIRNGWTGSESNKAEEVYASYYESDYYQKHVLSDSVKDLIQEKVETGTELEKQVISWAFEHIKTLNNLNNLQKNPLFTFITYEELTIKNEEVITYLSEELKLPNLEEMKRLIDKPSHSSHYSTGKTNKAIKESNKTFLIEKWKNKVTFEQQNEVSKILEHFNIDIYNGTSTMPKSSYKLFD